MKKLTENAKRIMECSYQDTIKDTKLNHFPKFTQQEIITSLNYVGEKTDSDDVESFLDGMMYERRSKKNAKK